MHFTISRIYKISIVVGIIVMPRATAMVEREREREREYQGDIRPAADVEYSSSGGILVLILKAPRCWFKLWYYYTLYYCALSYRLHDTSDVIINIVTSPNIGES
jgi:hypothetical protein